MSHIFGMIFTVVFFLFFTAYQSSANEIHDRVEILEIEREKIRGEMKKYLELEQRNLEEISRLTGKDKAEDDQIAELEHRRGELEAQLLYRKGVLTELNRVINLPGKVVRGEATEEEIQECGEFFELNCLTLPETANPDWWLEHHP